MSAEIEEAIEVAFKKWNASLPKSVQLNIKTAKDRDESYTYKAFVYAYSAGSRAATINTLSRNLTRDD